MKLLVELRPALEGHAGIPQEARLLFRGLGRIDGIEVQGLVQSSDRFFAPGTAQDLGVQASTHEQIDRLSRVVVSMQPPAAARGIIKRTAERASHWGALLTLPVRALLGRLELLTWFDPTHFRDFVWRGLFAKTLPAEDFDQVTSARFRILRAPYGAMHACGLATRWLPQVLYPRIDTRGIDAMLALTPYPAMVVSGTTLIVRYFDAVPLLMPHTIIHTARHQALHYQALRANVANGAWFVCCSDATRRDLLAVFPEVGPHAVTIPCMVSHHYHPDDSSPTRVPEILAKHINREVHKAAVTLRDELVDYLLMVSTLEPRKNHTTLVGAWEKLRGGAYPGLKLVLVGALGWGHAAILDQMRVWIDRGEVLLLAGVPADDLRLLYRHARATVCPSYGEGFGYSGVEAMRCGGVVAASDIAVHREVYADAAEYFNPYSALDTAAAIDRVIDPSNLTRRDQLIGFGEQVSARYLPDAVVPQWGRFLRGLPQRQ